MITPIHPGLRELFKALKDQERPVVAWRDPLGTEALIFGETMAAVVPGGPVRTMRLHRRSFRRHVRRLALGAVDAGHRAPRRPVVLVPCGRAQTAPAVARRLRDGEHVPVEEFYSSPAFRAALAVAKSLAPPSHIRLLSPHNGLLTLSDWITCGTADDAPLGHLTDAERSAWGWRIMSALLEDYGAEPRGYVLVGGQLHKETLLEAWPLQAPLTLVVATLAAADARRRPEHSALRTLVELHESLNKEPAAALLWCDHDGTEAVALGRRLFVAAPAGSVHTASNPRAQRGLGGPRPSIRQVTREILRRDRTVSPRTKLQTEIIDVVCRAGAAIGSNTIATTIHRRRSAVGAAIRRLVRDSILVPVEGGLIVSPEANPYATAAEIASVLKLAGVVTTPANAVRAEKLVCELEAIFAQEPPAASTLRAVVLELRAFVRPADKATSDALRRLESQLAREKPGERHRASDRLRGTDSAVAPAPRIPTVIPNRRRPS